MANYSLVIDSKFRPFEYQELLAPVLMATQAHQALEEAYGDLDTEASIWDRRTEGSERAHSLYTNFARDLDSAAEDLSKYGLTPQSRRTMLNMKSRYAKDITPIVEAWTKRQADIKAQQEALVKDPTHFFNRMANNTSLDEYMDNPTLDVLSDNYSGVLLTQQVGQAAANLKQALMKKGELTKLGLPYQYERMLQYGASADEVFTAMSKDPKALPVLTKLVEDVMASSGIRKWSSMNDDWANNDMYKRAEAYAMQGLYNAVGTAKIEHLTDSFNMQDQLNARQHARTTPPPQPNKLKATPLNIYSQRQLDKEEKEYNDQIKKFSKYFYKKDGKWMLTKAGWDEYNRDAAWFIKAPKVKIEDLDKHDKRLYLEFYRSLGVIQKDLLKAKKGYISMEELLKAEKGELSLQDLHAKHVSQPTEFRKFLDSHGMKGMSSTSIGPWQREKAGSIWGTYVTDTPKGKTAKYDATKVTEFDYKIAGSQQEAMKDAILTAARGSGGLKEVDYDPVTKTFKPTGDKESIEALLGKDYKVVSTRFSPYGNTVMISDGTDIRRFEMPGGIDPTNEDNRNAMMSWAKVLQDNRKGGTIRIPDDYADLNGLPRGTTITATSEQVQDEYDETIQKAYLYHSQLGGLNKVEDQEFNQYGY